MAGAHGNEDELESKLGGLSLVNRMAGAQEMEDYLESKPYNGMPLSSAWHRLYGNETRQYGAQKLNFCTVDQQPDDQMCYTIGRFC